MSCIISEAAAASVARANIQYAGVYHVLCMTQVV
jgi:hypothetical protein